MLLQLGHELVAPVGFCGSESWGHFHCCAVLFATGLDWFGIVIDDTRDFSLRGGFDQENNDVRGCEALAHEKGRTHHASES